MTKDGRGPKWKKIEHRKGSKLLRVDLTQEELIAAGQEMADAQATIAAREAELESFKKQIQADIKAAESTIEAKAELIRQGYEVRDVKTDTTLDFDLGRTIIIRKDTGDTVEDRDMTDDERERELTLFPTEQDTGLQVIDGGEAKRGD
jgi:hypothetical protein